MRSLLRTVPLIGALLISAAPVQAFEINPPQDFETFEELEQACEATDEGNKLCIGSMELWSAMYLTGTLCQLEDEGWITEEQVAEKWKGVAVVARQSNMFKAGIKKALEMHPTCSIKPIP